MGITQHTHGTDNVNAIANPALLTGNIGKEHTGINPLRGQNMSRARVTQDASPNVYPGYQRIDMPMVKRNLKKHGMHLYLGQRRAEINRDDRVSI